MRGVQWLRLVPLFIAAASIGVGVYTSEHQSKETSPVSSAWLQKVGQISAQSSSPQLSGPSPEKHASLHSRSTTNARLDTKRVSKADQKQVNVKHHATTISSLSNSSVVGSNQNSTQQQKSKNSVSTRSGSDSSSISGASSVSATQHTSTPEQSSSSSEQSHPYGEFTLIVSKFEHVIAQKEIPIVPDENLMQYTEQNFQVQTAYGGGFVVSINGIRSQWTGVPVSQRKPYDWFLYINGQEAPVGALQIIPKAGDVDVWDYHKWNPATGQG
ncbi:DUF4430 domain-containing protein [Alicyclobacillus tolerans]|uniref:Transcobalamin-like C-terminal domain-containing protein n=1 Tax=Alicyclobacillus tolerans TaxID=90970 RepID=A0ABT9LSC1_9BACL|nr:DUF4430 domain-containing protein [Alicyclobacillus tengchongensis]MDP9727162.1 hypothetical protein [Alicyclobacillus tengchongensis]